ncbi:hypothetical protein EAH89_01345 [Roseomonas nepalensis]|uniref:Uncharacterized protein n=1 Tax=Muricoccus nepalensis TaxID=1854500 RepID=A0A502GHG5_9PROT|nr:hypothetical protein EAH89_01345 [Roseomonas nepalensis]
MSDDRFQPLQDSPRPRPRRRRDRVPRRAGRFRPHPLHRRRPDHRARRRADAEPHAAVEPGPDARPDLPRAQRRHRRRRPALLTAGATGPAP